MNKNNYLPLLCTRGVVVFPNVELSLEVARPFSVNAVEYARELDEFNNYVMVVSQIDIDSDNVELENCYMTGTICEVAGIRKRTDFNRVILRAVKRASITNAHFDTNYKDGVFMALCEDREDVITDERELKILKTTLTELVRQVISKRMDAVVFNRVIAEEDPCLFANLVAQFCVYDLKLKNKLLTLDSVVERYYELITYLQSVKETENIEKEIETKVQKRLADTQNDYMRKERLKEIQAELTKDEETEVDDIVKLKEKFENEPFPEHVKKKALEEIKHYNMMQGSSQEANLIRNYLDWLYEVPWYQKSNDNEDLNLASKILDEDHYGLEKVKERILEYLAVKQMTGSLKAPIICLVGPPGVGKTSLARSIARAVDRKFVKASLGGCRDESTIKGHRRTYVASVPGRIITGMKKAGVINPVFLLDEIDKMASDYRGDPTSALLEVLDPEQNFQFSDDYLEEAYDLSNVLFIATANYLENIPAPLRDRLEIINLSSYTEIEKVEIAKKHLIPKQLEANGISKTKVSIGDKELVYLIQRYTREAGVRQLERLIATLFRKAVLQILKEGKKKVTLTKATIKEYLGHEIFDYGEKEKKNQVGVVTGLAYTEFGGDVLPIEVTYFDGKGALHSTGKLGEVMKESVEIAYSYVRANAKTLGIDPKFFETHDLHIHAPEGAVPKDGPSAGVTITTAITSAILGKKVDHTVAMTGEVTLRGNVLPIGGLKEKSLAAHRSGIKTIIFPKDNLRDLEDVPETVKEKIEYIPVDNVMDVIKRAII